MVSRSRGRAEQWLGSSQSTHRDIHIHATAAAAAAAVGCFAHFRQQENASATKMFKAAAAETRSDRRKERQEKVSLVVVKKETSPRNSQKAATAAAAAVELFLELLHPHTLLGRLIFKCPRTFEGAQAHFFEQEASSSVQSVSFLQPVYY